MNGPINYLDLFSGIGGFAQGLVMANIPTKVELRSEIEYFADKVYAKSFPFSRNLGDITKIDGVAIRNKYPGDWLITGGFPCQDISLAGKGAGIHGIRSGLWWHYWRLIRDIQPRWVVVENVPALTRRGLYSVLKSLAVIGYNAEWYTLSAHQYGAPHYRNRIFIVANPNEGSDSGARKKPTSVHQRFEDMGTSHMGDDTTPTIQTNRVEFWAERLRACTEGKIRSVPGICRVDDGLRNRIHRCSALGNAVVPQIIADILRELVK